MMFILCECVTVLAATYMYLVYLYIDNKVPLHGLLISMQDAFWALVSLFERSKYLAGFYDSSLSK